MNDTVNHSVMEEYNSPERCHKALTSCLQGLEEKELETSVAIDHLKSLVFFLNEFFQYANLDPDSDNKDLRECSNIRIYHYVHYRNLYEVLVNEIYKLDEKNERAEQYLERAIKELNRITSVCV